MDMMNRWPRWAAASLRLWPLGLGLAFCAASFTPSLIARPPILQGMLGGVSLGIGYAIGAWISAFWRAFELPAMHGKLARVVNTSVLLAGLVLSGYCAFHTLEWQNSVRDHLSMERATEANVILSMSVATLAFLFLVGLARLVKALVAAISHAMGTFLSPRAANLTGLLFAALLLVVFTDRAIVRGLFGLADEAFATSAAFLDPEEPQPTEPDRSGSKASLLDWAALGSQGRRFVSSGPNASDIAAFTGQEALQPLRIYVGREQGDTPEKRADAALAEMERVGAFDRSVLVLAIPTGTGWLDPGSHDAAEFLHHGDIATVAVQYSYLSSPLALVFETNTGLEQAVLLFNRVYDRWASIPRSERPRLYLHGLSLGSWASMHSLDPFRMLGDPVDGAFWVGPPFPSDLWRRATASRQQGSPFVLPVAGGRQMVRFTNGRSNVPTAGWDGFRVLYLQHGSDPIVFYDPATAWKRPEWLQEPPAPDVSPFMRWTPVVTMVQLALDMALSKVAPAGFGHNYDADEYIRSWIAISEPEGWTEGAIRRLEERCGRAVDTGCME